MKKISYIKFGIDLLMAITFVLFFDKQVLGGLPFHEMAGLTIAIIFFTHVLLNWRWVKKMTIELFNRKLPFKTKFSYFLNVFLLISMAFIMISGIFISRVAFPNINVANEQWFKISHMSISYVVLILVAAHIGLHWKWVVHVFKSIFSFKTSKPFFRILAKVVTIALLMFGGYQMYSSHFFMHVQAVGNVINFSSKQIPGDGFKNGEQLNIPKGSFEAEQGHDRPTPPKGDFNGREDHFDRQNSPEDFKGVEGHLDSPNALYVIVRYFSMMSVFIIFIYYIEKYLLKNKRKKQTEC